jgi:hypothetical protein
MKLRKIISNLSVNVFPFITIILLYSLVQVSTNIIVLFSYNVTAYSEGLSGGLKDISLFTTNLLVFLIFYIISFYFIYTGYNKNIININYKKRIKSNYLLILVSTVLIILFSLACFQNYTYLAERVTFFNLMIFVPIFSLLLVIVYNIYDKIKNKKKEKNKLSLIYFLIFSFIIFVSIIFIWSNIESPAESRKAVQNNKILRNVNLSVYNIYSYYEEFEKLPNNIDDIRDNKKIISNVFYRYSDNNFVNPITKKQFDYKKISDDTYQICTDFLINKKRIVLGNYISYGKASAHFYNKGYNCLEIMINNPTYFPHYVRDGNTALE